MANYIILSVNMEPNNQLMEFNNQNYDSQHEIRNTAELLPTYLSTTLYMVFSMRTLVYGNANEKRKMSNHFKTNSYFFLNQFRLVEHDAQIIFKSQFSM